MKKFKILSLLLISCFLMLNLFSCVSSTAKSIYTGSITSAVYEYDDQTIAWDTESAGVSSIPLSGKSDVNITVPGTYVLTGVLEDGQIVIDSPFDETVFLILDGADITCTDSAAIYILNAGKTVITLADDSVNSITDGVNYYFENGAAEPSAAIYSKDDLTINGSGALTVTANYNHGIYCTNDLKIISGHITVNSANDAIKGKDSVTIRNGMITINAGGDGIQSSNTEETEKGCVIIEDGTLNITAVSDGIQAETELVISGGNFNIITGGGSAGSLKTSTDQNAWGGSRNIPDVNSAATSEAAVSSETSVSAKALKSGSLIMVTGGILSIDSSDDAIHSGGDAFIKDGTLILTSGDDGIHAENSIQIDGGTVNLTKSYEGLESASITVNGGDITVNASDDGINATGGGTGLVSAFGGQGGGDAVQNANVYINGGILKVYANGDGLDSNGSIYLTAGEVYVDGPTNSGNGALDYNGTFELTGGRIIAAGSSGMAQNASAVSTQYSALAAFTEQTGGTEFTLADASGNTILSYTPTKNYACVMISCPELQSGETYTITVSGSTIAAFTQSSVITSSGSFGGMGNMGGGGRPGR